MAEELVLSGTADRAALYEEVIPQIKALTDGEPDMIANLANVTAVLRQAFGFFWVGFYLEKDGELVLGPFQGTLACTRIGFGKGVCGSAYEKQETLIVPDVNQFPGHIVCSSDSKSEIVVPIFDRTGKIIGVLDVDSDTIDDFSKVDAAGLEKVAEIVGSFCHSN